MMLPHEMSYRVPADESVPQRNTFEIAGGQAEFDKETRRSSPIHHHRALLKAARVIEVSYSDNRPSGLS